MKNATQHTTVVHITAAELRAGDVITSYNGAPVNPTRVVAVIAGTAGMVDVQMDLIPQPGCPDNGGHRFLRDGAACVVNRA